MSFQRRAASFDLARRAGARYVGANGASLEEYMASGTYAPTITFSASGAGYAVDMAGDPGDLAFSRVGSGIAVPQAGDTVHAFGAMVLTDLTNGETVGVQIPFLCSMTSGPVPIIRVVGLDLVTSTGELTADDTVSFTVAVPGVDDFTVVTFEIVYQTANAVDP